MKDCQRAFEEYQTTLRLEKEYLSSMSGEDQTTPPSAKSSEQSKSLLNERKKSVESCNQKAAQFVQLAKVSSFKNYLVL